MMAVANDTLIGKQIKLVDEQITMTFSVEDCGEEMINWRVRIQVKWMVQTLFHLLENE